MFSLAIRPTGNVSSDPKGIVLVIFIIYELTHSGTYNAQRACALSQYLRRIKLIIAFFRLGDG